MGYCGCWPACPNGNSAATTCAECAVSVCCVNALNASRIPIHHLKKYLKHICRVLVGIPHCINEMVVFINRLPNCIAVFVLFPVVDTELVARIDASRINDNRLLLQPLDTK